MSISRIIICLLGMLLVVLPAFGLATESPNDMAGTGYFRDQDTQPGVLEF